MAMWAGKLADFSVTLKVVIYGQISIITIVQLLIILRFTIILFMPV